MRRKIEYKIIRFVSDNLLIKAITFDLWNTLLEDKDFTALRMEIMNKILLDHGVLKSHEEMLEAYRSAAACYRKEWEENYRHMSVESRVEHMLQTLRVNGRARANKTANYRWIQGMFPEGSTRTE